jgi:hypothetical protein
MFTGDALAEKMQRMETLAEAPYLERERIVVRKPAQRVLFLHLAFKKL